MLELQTQEALDHFDEGQALLLRGIAAIEDYSLLARSFIDQGAAFIDAGKEDKAVLAFKRAIAIGADVTADARTYNPATVQAFLRAQKQLNRSARGTLTIVSKPEGARVVLDGKVLGETPVSLTDLIPGDHWLVVSAPGFYRYSSRVGIAPSKSERVETFLRKLNAPADAPTVALAEQRQGLLSEAPPRRSARSLALRECSLSRSEPMV
jgi:hypothetical protein